jgi:DNA-binding Lrp family transcriptional regulator
MKLDHFDAKILDALQRDGRRSVVDLAESIGLSPTPCARRIKALETDGAIEGYAAILNPARVGLAVLAIVQVKLTEHTDETVARFEREIERMGHDRQLRLHLGGVWQGFGSAEQRRAEEAHSRSQCSRHAVERGAGDRQAHGANSAHAPANLIRGGAFQLEPTRLVYATAGKWPVRNLASSVNQHTTCRID